MVNVGFSHKRKLAIFGSIDCFFTAIRSWDFGSYNSNKCSVNCTQENARYFVSLEGLDKT